MGLFMITNIKSFLDSLDEKEKINEQKSQKKNRARIFNTKMPKSFFKHPIYQPINEIIISKNPFSLIPRRWKELEIDFENILTRDYPTCNKTIVKVSNLYNYKNSIDKYSYLAIPISSPLYNELYQKYKFQIEIYIFVQIARIIIQDNGYKMSRDIHNCNSIETLNLLLSDLLEYSYINHRELLTQCHKLSVNIFELLTEIHNFFKDEILHKNTILMKNILKKYNVNK